VFGSGFAALRLLLVGALVAAGHYLVQLSNYAQGHLQGIEVLSQREPTPGTTWLLVGNDERGQGGVYDPSTIVRPDSILVLHQHVSGQTSLISIPRFSQVEHPRIGQFRLFNAFSFGGPQILVETIEELTGLTIDRYVETGFDGLYGIVDALGGLELCLDYDVDDEKSFLQWEAGCHLTDGRTAIAFARMRYSDPENDIGRDTRHRQIISALTARLAHQDFITDPQQHRAIIRSGLSALTLDNEMRPGHFAQLALAFRNATGPNGFTGAPPIADIIELPVGALVRLDAEAGAEFWQNLRNGTLTTIAN